MKWNWLATALLAVLFLVVLEAAGAPVALAGIVTLSGWLRALPSPTDEFAKVLSAWAWPIATLVIVYWLRSPLSRAANVLSERFGSDDLDLWGLKMSSGDRKIPLDRDMAANEAADFTPDDVERIERLYEFAGESAQNAGRLEDWISEHVSPNLEPVDFLSEPVFAREREVAYKDLVGGV